MASPHDPLLQRSIVEQRPGPAPWRTSSMFFVGFFGGALAVGVLATINARRLGASQAKVVTVALSSLALVGGWLAYAIAIYEPGMVSLRIATVGSGVVAHLVQQQVLTQETRVFELGKREPSTMWVPGIGAVIGSVVVVSVVLALTSAPQL